ncbi:MAG: glycine dehydrogenase subunit 2 [Steroidobacteraceae bacterium]|nr:glycine dehydrogenase subunit 2 [Steroidobacteraceae bacterium]
MKAIEPLIFELSRSGRAATAQYPPASVAVIPEQFQRRARPVLPEVSELQAVRHYTRLSQMNFSIDTQFYPLGSCTMKYNPKVCNSLAMLPEFLGRHPLAPVSTGQGFMACMFELQEMLKAVTGMAGVSLTPMAGAQGEFTGVAMIRAYHRARGDLARNEIIVPDAAHGTNPATATMCGMKIREIASLPDGDVDLAALDAVLSPATAGIMLTNPCTLGVFERRIVEIERRVHAAGGLLYYDGANLNAILGKVLPGVMGFDVIHMNLHKTFSTPHGGGGPGSGAVGVGKRRSRRRALSLARRARPAAVDRASVGIHGQCRRTAARLCLYAHPGRRGHGESRGVLNAECQLPDGAPARGRFRRSLS